MTSALEPRPDVVRRLLTARLDPTSEPAEATPAERALATAMHAQVVEDLRDHGVIPRERTFLDVTLAELVPAAAVLGVLQRYLPRHGDRSVGDVLKVATEFEVSAVRAALGACGWLPDEETS